MLRFCVAERKDGTLGYLGTQLNDLSPIFGFASPFVSQDPILVSRLGEEGVLPCFGFARQCKNPALSGEAG